MKESCPVNKAGIGLWQLLGLSELLLRCCYTFISGGRQPIKTATSHMLKAVNMDFPCDPAGWCCALLSQWVSHWEIQWFNNHFSHLASSSLLDSVQMCFKWFVCENVSGLSDISCWALMPFPHAHYLAESHHISFSSSPSQSEREICIYLHITQWEIINLMCQTFTSLWFLWQFLLWKHTKPNFFWYY